ncbi:DUF167 domain-containing protein [archaeon]|jgi:uncharacterized protein (TIGR00251 family)|nr:DUF167 domain-containing protein [archaeon]MBT6698426.1 DUF167 domain-containing protein [archaeon]
MTKYFIKVIPNSSRSSIVESEIKSSDSSKNSSKIKFKVYLKSVPEKGKANNELVKLFRKEKGWKVEVVRGLSSRNKVIKVLEEC